MRRLQGQKGLPGLGLREEIMFATLEGAILAEIEAKEKRGEKVTFPDRYSSLEEYKRYLENCEISASYACSIWDK